MQRFLHALTFNLIFFFVFLTASQGFAAQAPKAKRTTARGVLAPNAFRKRSPIPSFDRPRVNSDMGYHWNGLLVQSFEFNSMENVFRLATDNSLRGLLVIKPFWHDYISSLHHFDMNRWHDGDSFLVDYIGHSMHGSVAAYLEIQNSPTQSRVQWGEPGYWKSRWKAFWWATVYSTYSEIGPTGEAAIGNEGGFTYDTKCILRCKDGSPDPIRKYTNNTGWEDFIVTPTAGMVWVVSEDIVDREVIERFLPHGRHAPMYAKIIRGTLNPTRTMANFLRGRKPWYRDWEYPGVNSLNEGPSMGFIQGWEKPTGALEAYPAWKRVEIAPHWTSFATTITTADCHYCVRITQGAGVQVSVELWKYLYADADVSYQPDGSPRASDRAGGDLTTGYFGIRIGRHWPLYAVNLSIRPGFLHWNDAYLTELAAGHPHASPAGESGHARARVGYAFRVERDARRRL